MIETLNLLTALTYTALIVAIALRQLDRVMRHRIFARETPDLLIRDLVFFWALVVLIGIPTLAGAAGISLGNLLWWVILRSLVGVSVLVVWAWFEFFRIGRQP